MTTRRFLAALALVGVFGLTLPVGVGAAVNYFNATRTVSGTGTVGCPHGYHVTGGGITLAPPFAGSAGNWSFQTIGESRPTTNGWTASAYALNVDPDGSLRSASKFKPKVYAICVT